MGIDLLRVKLEEKKKAVPDQTVIKGADFLFASLKRDNGASNV